MDKSSAIREALIPSNLHSYHASHAENLGKESYIDSIRLHGKSAIEKAAVDTARGVENFAMDAGALAKTVATDIATDLASGISELDAEIANHYNSGLKYGMAGSNGGLFSNYWRYQINNHEVISVFCADRRNPNRKHRRLFALLNKAAMCFFLTVLLDMQYPNHSDIVSIVLNVVILAPYGTFIDALATCEICHEKNICIKCSHIVGDLVLVLFTFFVLFMVGAGVYLLAVQSDMSPEKYCKIYFLSLLFEQLMPFYLGMFNWILYSWEGFLFIPVFSCCGCKFPFKFLPILGFWPIKVLLNVYFLGEQTYAESKEAFQEKYPGRVCIDKPCSS